jgi:hypothetical protein
MNKLAALEASLCAAYAEEREHYAQALALANILCDPNTSLAEGHERLQQILALLDSVRRIEDTLGESKQAWQASGRRPGEPFALVLAQVSILVQQLTEAIHKTEERTIARRNQLLPALDIASRGRQMIQAYSRQ